MTAVKLLSRIWLPLVIVLVLGFGGYAVVRLHSVFGFEKPPTYAQGPVADTKPGTPQANGVRSGRPDGRWRDISYFDAEARPQQISGAAFAVVGDRAVGFTGRHRQCGGAGVTTTP